MKNYKKNVFFISILILLLNYNNTFSQNEVRDSIMAVNRKFKNEIGIDFQQLFIGNAGTSFIWKVKKKQRNGLVSLTFSRNLRFQLAINVSMPISSNKEIKENSLLNVMYTDSYTKRIYIKPLIGIEKIKYYQKFGIFYGLDFGPNYNYSLNTTSYYGDYNQNNTFGYPQSSAAVNEYGISIQPFIGVKYRFSERFSVSMESGFAFTYQYADFEISATDYNESNNVYNKFLFNKTESRFAISMMYLRFLNLNYHF